MFSRWRENVYKKDYEPPQVLRGIYRETEDLYSKVDSELMRVFPPLMDQEHILFLMDQSQRKQYLDEVSKSVHEIGKLNKALNEEKVFGPLGNKEIIDNCKKNIKE
mmetsp:Transcript_41979/g.64276  ORF Transcript_41979/g.64276 Transcript_41979/m.64276 type:complete len:106 (-) Transcript_41979:1605-1922(-)